MTQNFKQLLILFLVTIFYAKIIRDACIILIFFHVPFSQESNTNLHFADQRRD